jgi:hypothetical protein
MPGPHQIGAGVLPSPDQIPRRLLSHGRHPHGRQLPNVQQPGQPFGVAPVGLDPIPGRAFQLGRGHHHTAHPGCLERPGQPEPGRAGRIGTATGPGNETVQATTASVASGSRRDHSSPVSRSSTPATIERACTSSPTNVPSSTIRRLP